MVGAAPVFASIVPVADVWQLDYLKLFTGHVIARIESTDKYPALGLIKGNNYLFVWKAGKFNRMAVLNEAGRQELDGPMMGLGGAQSGGGQPAVGGLRAVRLLLRGGAVPQELG